MQELADKYAAFHNTKIIAFKDYKTHCVFVLEAGQKLSMTESELKAEISNLEQAFATKNPGAVLRTIAKIKATERKGKK